jgi:hypothetical protein
MMEHACAASSIYCSKRCGWCQGYSYIPPLHKPPRRAAMRRALSLRLRQQDCPTPAPVHNSASRTSFTDTYACPTNVLAAFVASRSSTTSCSIRATSSSTLWTVRPPHTSSNRKSRLSLRRCGASLIGSRSIFGSSLSVAADELDRPALSLNKSKLTSLLELSLRTVRSQYAVLYGMLRAVHPRVAVVHAMVPWRSCSSSRCMPCVVPH